MQYNITLKDLYDFVDEYFHSYTCFYTAIIDTSWSRTFSVLVRPYDSDLYYVFILVKHPLKKYFSAFLSFNAALFFLKKESFNHGLN